MTCRSVIITQIHTDCAVVREAYAGNAAATLEEIDVIIHREIKPRLNSRGGLTASTPSFLNWRTES